MGIKTQNTPGKHLWPASNRSGYSIYASAILHLHFIPTSASWLNLVERWFGGITRERIRRGVFKSVKELIEAIEHYVKTNNQNPKPFVWTKRVAEILEKVNHCKASTVRINSGHERNHAASRRHRPWREPCFRGSVAFGL